MTAPQRNDLVIIVYAPELVRNDGRPLAVIQGMERAFPGLRLVWTTSDEGERTHLADRDAWLAQQRLDGEFPLLHNGDERDYASVSGWAGPASSASSGQAQLEVHAKLPLNASAISAAMDVLEAVAQEARAFWGHATPFSAARDIAGQVQNPELEPQTPPRGLPPLKTPRSIPSPEIPQRLGWLNYWSASAAQALGFPDAARDADLLTRARRTVSGGWMVQLTQEPLDLDNSEHLEVLLRTYERFPRVGGRVSS
jgi:hypothetical protein